MTTENPYDVTPYPGNACTASHPSHLAAIAALFGLPFAPPATGRTLEIGCASGENLLPMAAAFPGARFTGLDFSQVQIDAARRAQAELGLTNVEFICADIRSADAGKLGLFDYVIAHGIYSWLPPDAQTAMLALARACLAEDGIAYISYNTLPGWRMRGIIRDMMLFHGELYPDQRAKVTQAKLLLDFMATHVPAENNPYGQFLRSELQMVSQVDENYLSHDHLEVNNEALYFRDFMTRANAADLDYLGEADFATMAGTGIALDAVQKLNSEIKDIVRLEQYYDFMRNRTFRMTLLVRRGKPVQRQVSAASLTRLHASSSLTPAGENDLGAGIAVKFQSVSGNILQTANPVTKAALQHLRDIFPRSARFGDLLAAARQRLPQSHRDAVPEEQDRNTLGNDLLIAYALPGQLQLHGADLGAARNGEAAGALLGAPAYARWQAGHSAIVTNVYHVPVQVNEAGRQVLMLLDGKRDRAALAAQFHQLVVDGKLTLTQEGAVVDPDAAAALEGPALDAILEYLSQWALLCRVPPQD